MPMTLRNMIDRNTKSALASLIIFLIYWSQYTINFIIYAACSKQYRRAYIMVLRLTHNRIKGCFKRHKPVGVRGKMEAVVYIERTLLPRKIYQFYKYLEDKDIWFDGGEVKGKQTSSNEKVQVLFTNMNISN